MLVKIIEFLIVVSVVLHYTDYQGAMKSTVKYSSFIKSYNERVYKKSEIISKGK